MSYLAPDLYGPFVTVPFLKSLGILAGLGILEIETDLTGSGTMTHQPKIDQAAAFQRRDVSTTSATRSFTEMASFDEIAVILHDDSANSALVAQDAFSGANYRQSWLQSVGWQWARRCKQQLYRCAKTAVEVCDTTDGSTASADCHISDVYNATAQATMTFARLQAARAKLGDASGLLSVAVMHSTCWNNLVVDGISNYKIENVSGKLINEGGISPSKALFMNNSYQIAYCDALGMIIVVDDDMSSISMTGSTYTYKTKYETLLFGPGALKLQFQRNLLLAEDENIADARGVTRRMRAEVDYAIKVPGVKWSSSTVNPTDTQLGTKSNWDEVYKDHKETLIAKLITNG